MSNIITILCSHLPLPYYKIGSWTTMFDTLFREKSEIDVILCPQPQSKYKHVAYLQPNLGFTHKLKRKLGWSKKYDPYYGQLRNYLNNTSDAVVIQVVDNAGFVFDLHTYLVKNKLRNRCFIQYYYHGFLPFYDGETAKDFLKGIDEHIFLTASSKDYHVKSYPTYNSKSIVIHNGIDKNKFKPISFDDSSDTRKSYLIDESTTVFLWLSQDREKKGLSFLLSFWETFIEQYPDSLLIIIGTHRDVVLDKTMVLGRIPNEQLPSIYQMIDVYLFPTLWEEGFGLSLVEALSCGCYCIASKIGGVPEVLGHGNYGVLVEDPWNKDLWLQHMKNAYHLKNDGHLKQQFNLPKNKYNIEVWKQEMNAALIETKKEFYISLQQLNIQNGTNTHNRWSR
ncbi:glycosyltransferase family 4 protein [Nonlabens sp.]|uniref:glycosyltransferase family 4 protein n=1 Tax=Nonlabens sp. TaxID=1888209 RepID=UPI003F69BDB9